MFSKITNSVIYPLPLAIILALLNTYLLFIEGNQKEVYILETNDIDFHYVSLMFLSTFAIVYAIQITVFISIYALKVFVNSKKM